MTRALAKSLLACTNEYIGRKMVASTDGIVPKRSFISSSVGGALRDLGSGDSARRPTNDKVELIVQLSGVSS